MEGISTGFANFLRGPLSSAVGGCVVCDDYIVVCACIIMLSGNCLLMDSGSVEDEFVYHCCIHRTLSLLSLQFFFVPSVLFFPAMLLVILRQYALRSTL